MNTNVVVCPKCQTRCQIPASVPQFTCPGCGQLCRGPVAPVAAATSGHPGSPPAKISHQSAKDDRSGGAKGKAKGNRNAIYAAAAIGAAVVMLLFIAATFFVLPGGGSDAADRETAQIDLKAEADAAAEQARRDAIVYRQVDLPEETRRRLFTDLNKTKSTTVDAKIPLPKDSQTRKFLDSNFEKLLDREIEMQSIMNKVSPEDLREILKEGDAKAW